MMPSAARGPPRARPRCEAWPALRCRPARPPARVRRVAGLGGAHRSALRAEREALVASATALGLKDIVLRRLVREVDLQEAQPGP